MKCSIENCPNAWQKGVNFSFHKFPNNPKLLTAWVAATGVPYFIPTHLSKVCSAHFGAEAYNSSIDGVRKRNDLKPDAVPTKLLPEDATRWISEYLRKERERNAVACILDTSASMEQVAVVKDDVPPRPKAINISTPPSLTPATGSTIKVVDMKKLLQPEAQNTSVAAEESGEATSIHTLMGKYIYQKEIHKYSPESFVNRTGVTANQVLTCLRIILPVKFDYSRMIPNEKVTSLVIRYLKLNEKDEHTQKVIKYHLELIIESAKIKDQIKKNCLDFTNHPYTKIKDRELKNALSVILSEQFSMVDITDELLKLLCIVLNVRIHPDAYHILIRKIRKFTSEGQKFTEILNQADDVPVKPRKDSRMDQANAPGSQKNSNNREVAREHKESVRNQNGLKTSVPSSTFSNNNVDHLTGGGNEFVVAESSSDGCITRSDLDPEWVTKYEKTAVRDPKFEKLNGILKFIRKRKCSAEDVLASSNLKFHLCRFISIRPRRENIKYVESKLQFIIDTKIDVSKKIYVSNPKDPKQCIVHSFKHTPVRTKSNHSPKALKNIDVKLQMKPVVLLNDLIDFNLDQLLFMKKIKKKRNHFHNQVTFSMKPNTTNKKYSTEEVRRLTDESYKQFRRVLLKRNGTKAFACVKYTKLTPGTMVYAKNFRHPDIGWVKAVVIKSEGHFKYQVQLENKSLWSCTVEQLRPVFNQVSKIENQSMQRRQRPIKPRQLFDL